MYKLIASDMDGTLLNSVGEIPAKNVEAVKKAMDAGVEFAIVTGRPYASARSVLSDNGIINSAAVIGCNGAQVTDKHGNLIKSHYLDKDSLIKIMELAEEKNIYYQIYDDNYIFTKSRLKLLNMIKNYSGKSLKKHITLRNIVNGFKRLFFADVKVKKNIIEYAKAEEKGFYKIQVASTDQKQLNSFRGHLKDIPNIDITSSFYFNLEIGPVGITKGTALRELAESQGIAKEDVIAFGDNYNDIPMIEYAGCGVAMENSVQPLKDKADFFTKSNDENGVAYAIEKLIFEKE